MLPTRLRFRRGWEQTFFPRLGCASILYSSGIAYKDQVLKITFQKEAFSNILKILPPKNKNFEIKLLIIFIFLLKT